MTNLQLWTLAGLYYISTEMNWKTGLFILCICGCIKLSKFIAEAISEGISNG